MPMGTPYRNTEFKQIQYISQLSDKRIAELLNKIIGFSHPQLVDDIKSGLCYGLSSYYLMAMVNGKETEFISDIQRLANIVNSDDYISSDPVVSAYVTSIKEKSNELLNNYLTKIIKYQYNKDTANDIYEYIQNYTLPEVNKNERFSAYLERMYQYNEEHHINKDNINLQHYHKKIIHLMERYYHALFANTQFFETDEGKQIYHSEAFKKITTLYGNRTHRLNSHIEQYDMQYFFDTIASQLKHDLLSDSDKIMRDYGLSSHLTENAENFYGDTDYYNTLTLGQFFELISQKKDSVYYSFLGDEHAMAFAIEKEQQTGELIYKFFEPNKGEVQYKNIEDMKNLIMKEYSGESNDSLSDIVNKYPVYIREYEKTPQTQKYIGLETINEKNIDITVAKLLSKNKTKIVLDSETNIMFDGFIEDKNILKIKLEYKECKIIVYTDALNINELKLRLIENSKVAEIYHERSIFVSQENYKAYLINDLNKLMEVTSNNVEDLFGKSDLYLSENVDDLFQWEILHTQSQVNDLSQVELNDPSSTNISHDNPLVEYELSWIYPTENPELIPQHSSEEGKYLDSSNYDHNIIFQLEFDPGAINTGSASMIGKHPKNTTLVLFDVKNNRYEIVYGDIKRVVKGKTRWLVAGHGTFNKNQQTLFANLTPQELANGLAKIKQHLSSLQDPDKIVLVGCALASGNEKENFARNVVEPFHKKGFDVPIVAYTENVYVDTEGRKGMMRNINFRDENFKHIYQWDNQYSQILVNNRPEIILLFEKLINNNIDFHSFITGNRKILSNYFNNKEGELDESLIRKVAYHNDGNEIFNEVLSTSNSLVDGDFYNILVNKIESAGIDKTPIWKNIDKKYITENIISIQAENNDTLDVIFRIKDNDSIRKTTEQIAIKKPNNTLIIQVDVINNTTYIEYGDLTKLETASKQKWSIVDYIGREESYSQIYAQLLTDGLLLAKSKYDLKEPENIDFININKSRKPYHLGESLSLANNILVRLLGKDINTDLYLDSYNNVNDMVVDDHFINKTKFSYNTEEHVTYVNGEHRAKYIISDIVMNRLPLSELNLHEYPSLIPYLSNSSGKLDKNKLLLIINDPFVSINVNEYFTNKEYLDPDFIAKWDNRINQSNIATLKQQAIDSSFLLNAIYENPNIISYLGKHASFLLSDLFPQDEGYHIGDILEIITQPEKLTLLQGKLNAFIGLDAMQSFEHISLKSALGKSNEWNSELLKNYISMQGILNRHEIDTQVNFINHGFYLADDNDKNRVFKDVLGQLYAFCKGSEISSEKSEFVEIVNYAVLLNTKKETVKLSAEENLFLSNYQGVIFYLMKEMSYERPNSIGTMIKNSSFNKWLSEATPGNYKIKSIKGDFTIIIEQSDDIYKYRFYDTEGLEAIYSDKDKGKVINSFSESIIKYLNSKADLYDDNSYSSDNNNAKDYLVDVEHISVRDKVQQEIQQKIKSLIVPKKVLTEMVNIGDVNISTATLHRLGATIDNVPLNETHLKSHKFYKNIRFNAETLSARLTFIEGNKEDAVLIKALKQIMLSKESKDIIHAESELSHYSTLLKQLDYIDHYTDITQDYIDVQLWPKLQSAGIKLPRYIEVMNRTGQTMTAAGFITLLTSTYGMMQQLDNPLLSAAERAEIHKNLGIAWASGLVNLSDMAQPTLLKIAYQQTGSFKAAGTLAGHVSIGLLLIGIGFDIYNAYDNFAKLAVEKNDVTRQDLIVNGTLSLVGIGVGVTSIIGMLASAAAAGPFGIIAGAALMFGGMIYNAVRAVNKIKQQISLTADEEFTTGARIALGLAPVISVQNKLRQKATEQAMEEVAWQYDQQFYINTILPSGFDTHLYIEENITAKGEDGYYLVDADGDYFGGTLQTVGYDRFLSSLGLINDDEALKYYSQANATLFSLEEAKFLLQSDILILPSGESCDCQSGKMSDQYHIEKAELKRYPNEQQKASDEIIILNNSYKNAQLPTHISALIESNQNVLVQTHGAKQLRLYTLNQQGIDAKMRGEKLNEKSFVEFDNINEISKILNKNRVQSGFSFNSANGNDIIIGHKDEQNNFEIHEGEKFFVGGDNQDRFYYIGHNKTAISDSTESEQETKSYLDGQAGNDFLVLGNIIDGIQVEADLTKGELRHKDKNNLYTVAILKNIENIIGQTNHSEILIGNDKNNYLDGSGGNDYLYAYDGDDKLALDQGYANGGLGRDHYFIQKYKWSHYAKDLFLNKRTLSRKSKKIFYRKVLNEKFSFVEGYSFDSQVIIDENDKDSSFVELDYSLKHINKVELHDNDLHLTINSHPYKITKNINSDKYCEKSRHKIILKNVYRDKLDENKKITQHKYTLKTKDGFILSSKLDDYLTKDPEPKLFFDINYISTQDKYIEENYEIDLRDRVKNNIVTDVYASTNNKTLEIIVHGKRAKNDLTIIFKRNYRTPSWGEFLFSGSSGKLGFSGDDENNTLVSIGNDSYIYASRGSDYYEIDTTNRISTHKKQSRITFDFSRLEYPNGYVDYNNNLDKNDKIIIMLKNDNATDLIIENNTLYFFHKENLDKVPIEFINYQRSISNAIFIHDKYKNILSVNVNTEGGSIKWLNQPIIPTNKDDVINISSGLPLKHGIIDGKKGNDIIVSKCEQGREFKGSEGNDIITVYAGDNVLYGGAGNDKLYAGVGDDLLLATEGNDQLFGGKGNDRYLIDGSLIGDVTIEDSEGFNRLYLINFLQGNPNSIKQVNGKIHQIYRSNNGGSLTFIQQYKGFSHDVNAVYIDNNIKEKLINKINKNIPLVEDNIVDLLIQHIAIARVDECIVSSIETGKTEKSADTLISYFDKMVS
nr:C80 family cysteine peptidase [uncultured Moellerella sp.]